MIEGKAGSVSIDLNRIKEFICQIDYENLKFNSWKSEQFIQTDKLSEIAQFFFVGNAINFRFWYEDSLHVFSYKDYKGSTAMWAVIRDNPELMNANYLKNIELDKIYGLRDMPILMKRQDAFREIGSVLQEKYDGYVINLCEKCEWDALKIVEEISLYFPMWEDNYQGVAFRKRAILFVAMLHGRTLPNSRIKNIEKLHCLADYQVPKLLHSIGVLHYSDELNDMIKNHVQIVYRGNYETDIRISTIEAVKIICDQLNDNGIDVCPLQLDYYLWMIAHNIKEPYHLTDTVAY